MKFIVLFIIIQLSLTMIGTCLILEKLDAYEMSTLSCIVSKLEAE